MTCCVAGTLRVIHDQVITVQRPKMSAGDEDVRILESVVYFVDPKSPGSLGFLGGKERIRIPLKKEHHSLDTFRRHIVDPGLSTRRNQSNVRQSNIIELTQTFCQSNTIEHFFNRTESNSRPKELCPWPALCHSKLVSFGFKQYVAVK